MTAALVPRSVLPGIKRRDGYDLPPGLSFASWLRIRDLCEMLVEASPWWLVDVVAYGLAAFPDRYRASLPSGSADPYGVRQARLKQARWMAKKYPPGSGSRIPGVSFSHHRAVASLPHDERQALLLEAKADRLSTRAMLMRMRARCPADLLARRRKHCPTCTCDRRVG